MLAGLSLRMRRTICIQTPVKHLVRSSAHTRANRHFHKGCMSRSHLSKSDHKHRDAALHTWDNSLWFYSRRCTVWCCNPDIEHYFVVGVLQAWKIFAESLDHLPYNIEPENVTQIYTSFACWKEDLTKMRAASEFPEELNQYIDFLEKELEIPINIV